MERNLIKKRLEYLSRVLFLVAGAGVEPTSGDYEPPEIPFLHPAVIVANVF